MTFDVLKSLLPLIAVNDGCQATDPNMWSVHTRLLYLRRARLGEIYVFIHAFILDSFLYLKMLVIRLDIIFLKSPHWTYLT